MTRQLRHDKKVFSLRNIPNIMMYNSTKITEDCMNKTKKNSKLSFSLLNDMIL